VNIVQFVGHGALRLAAVGPAARPATPDEQILAVRAEADRDLAPYRRKVPAAQIEQLHKQYVHKRLLERYSLPRLSLFYM